MFDNLIGEFTCEDFASFIPKSGTWKEKTKIIGRDLVYGAVGLFVLDISWRLMDIGIDFVCNHISWMKWLAQ